MGNKIKLTFVVSLYIFAAYLNHISSNFIVKKFSMVKSDDLLFYFLKFKDLSKLNEIIMILSIITIIIYIMHYNLYKNISYYIFILATFQLFRAGIIIFTPLANPFPAPKFGLFHKFLSNTGMFPSGHTSVPFLGYLFSFDKKQKRYKILFITFFILSTVTMLISRGHYSIDIIGTIFISYSIVCFSNKYLKKYLLLENA